MQTPNPMRPPQRSPGHRRATPMSTGSPDPRPVTGYTAEVASIGGHDCLLIKLDAPCIVRDPHWSLINSFDGDAKPLTGAVVLDATQFYFVLPGGIPATYNFVAAPYQDTAVQNFQGGFVAPGAVWFQAPE